MQGVADGGKGTYPEGVFECGGGGHTSTSCKHESRECKKMMHFPNQNCIR